MITKLCPDAFSEVTSFLSPLSHVTICSISNRMRALGLDAGGWIKKTSWGRDNGTPFKIFVWQCAHRSLSHIELFNLDNPLLWLPRVIDKLELNMCTQNGKPIEDGIYSLQKNSQKFHNGPWIATKS